MLCRKCGKESPPESNYCLYCGDPVASGAEKDIVKPAKSRAKFVLIGLASVVFVIGVLIAVFFADVTAWAERAFLSPDLLMKKAIASVAQDAGIGMETFSVDSPRRYTLGLYLDEDLRQMLAHSEDRDSSWIADINLQILAGEADGISKVQTALFLKEEVIVGLEILQNQEKLWFGMPELNERYLEFPKETLGIEQQPEVTLDEDALEAYVRILADSIQNVKKDKTFLEVDGVRQTSWKLTADIDTAQIRQMLGDLAKQLREDEAITAIFSYPEDRVIFEEMVSKLEQLAQRAELELQLVIYLDRYNKLIGFDLQDGEGNTLFYCAKAVDDGQFACRTACGNVVLTGKGTISNGKETGQYRLRIDGDTVLSYQVKDFAVKNNGFTGSVIFPIQEATIFTAELNLELSQEMVSGANVLSLNLVSGGTAILGLTFMVEELRYLSIEEPEAVLPATQTDTMQNWIESLDWTIIFQRLKNAGVPIDVFAMLTEE